MRNVVARAMLSLGVVLLTLGALAGVANREVLDGRAFARHVDALRDDQAVARQLGAAITDRVLAADPDLVAIRPIVEASATALVRSPAFTPVVVRTARSVHSAFTRSDSPSVVLRLADVGALIVPALRAIAPDAAARLPDDLDVTLARVGGQSFAATPIRLAHLVRTLSWLLPALALLCFAAWVLLGVDRRRAVIATGAAVAVSGIAVAVAGLVIGSVIHAQDDRRLTGALVRALWDQLQPAVFVAAGVLGIAGLFLAVAAAGHLPHEGLRLAPARARAFVRAAGSRPWVRAGRAVGSVVVGAAVLADPDRALLAAAVVAGILLVGYGMVEVGAAAAGHRSPVDRPQPDSAAAGRAPIRPRRAAPVAVVCALLAAVLLIGFVGVAARPPRALGAAPELTGGDGCNGSVLLCSRRYDEVAYPATHNSMSAADEPGWFFPEQPNGILAQLRAGVRALLFDTWDAAPTTRAGVLLTASRSRAAALAEAEQTYGADVVASALRLRDAVGLKPAGPASPYLCHNLCELGSTPWEPVMAGVAGWMRAHPREVVTFFIQDEVSPADTAAVFQRAGLLPFVHTQQPGQPWPTLGQMIDSGRRLVVLMEHRDGGSAYPWLLPGFQWAQDTPYTFTSAAQFSCAPNRGPAGASLLLVNHWLSNFATRVADADVVNASDVLLTRMNRCRTERHHIPNFVAVDFYDRGDLFDVVDRLNGVR